LPFLSKRLNLLYNRFKLNQPSRPSKSLHQPSLRSQPSSLTLNLRSSPSVLQWLFKRLA
jgi:hypothetical protein